MQPKLIVSFHTPRFSRFLTKKRLLECALILLAGSIISYVAFRAANAQIIGVAQVGSGAPKTNASSSKAGSILFFHKYTSDSSNLNKVNTVLTITNANPNDGITVRLIAAHDCTTTDKFINLAANQSRTLLLSREFPDTTGSLVAVAVTPTGAPTQFNWLIGSATVKDAQGFEGSYNAFSVAKRTAGAVRGDGKTFALSFDGEQYDQLPEVIAIDNLQTPNADLTFYSPTPTLVDQNASTNAILDATIYDAKGKAYSTEITGYVCGLYGSLTDLWGDPQVTNVLKAGQPGWASFRASDQTDPKKHQTLPILGISFSPVTGKPQTGAAALQVLEWLEEFTIDLQAKTPDVQAAPETPTQDQVEPVGGATGASESKAGSILFYPRFVTSKAGTSLINLTNTHPAQKARVRLFFSTVAPNPNVSEKIVTVEPLQALSIKASDVTDGQRGWVMAMAISSGAQPIQFNHLIGSAHVTESSGVTTTFNALAVGKNSDGAVNRDEDDNAVATLNFNDEDFDRLPAQWGMTGVPNQSEYNSYLSYNRFSSSMLETPSTRGSGSVTVYDKTLAQFVGLIGAPELNLEDLSKSLTRLPAAALLANSGWLKLSTNVPSLAVISNFATSSPIHTPPDGWSGGLTGSGNLHILSTTNTFALKVPAGNPNNKQPVAEFSGLQFETEARSAAGTIVRLDGTLSSDADPEDTLKYEWYDNDKLISTAEISDYRLSLGSHEIKLIVTDTSGEASDPYLQTVDVLDRTAPTISRLPSAIDIFTPGTSAAVNFPLPYAYDAIDGVVRVTSSHNSGGNFPLGLTTVTFTATDRAGNKATAQLEISIVQGPTFSQTGGIVSSTAPFLPNLNDQYVKPGEIRKVLLKAEDVDGDPVTFRLSNVIPNVALGNYDPVARQATLFIGPRPVNAPPVQIRIEANDNKQQSYRTIFFQIANSNIPNDDTGSGGSGGGRSNRSPKAIIAPFPATIEATEVDGVRVTLNGLLSTDPDLDSLTYNWTVNGQTVAQTVTADVKLGIGVNTIVLTVNDGRGGVGVATATVQVLPRSLSVSSVTPSRLSRNTVNTLLISGKGFSERAIVFVPGGGVTTESYLSRTESSIVVSVRVASNAINGTRELIVINPDGKTATLRAGLTIR
jgi:hypothetical protein